MDKDKMLMQHQQALLTLLQEFDRVCRLLNIPYVLFAGTMLGAVRHQGFIPWDDDLDVMMLRSDYERFLQEANTVLDVEKFYLQKEFSQHWPMFFSKLRLNGTTCLEKYHPKDSKTHQGIYMDIFPCDNAARSSIGRRLQFLASKVVIAKSLDRRGYETDSKAKKMFVLLCRGLPMKPFLWLTKRGNRQGKTVHSFFGAASSYQKNIYPRSYFLHRIPGQFEGNEYPISAQYDALLCQLYGEYMVLPPEEQRKMKKHAILIDVHRSYEEYIEYHRNIQFEGYSRSIR